MFVQNLAKSALLQFTTAIRTSTDEIFYKTLDNRPEWIEKLIFLAHDNGQVLPNDHTYRFIYESLNLIAETDDIDDIDDVEPDPYYGELLEWLASNNSRSEYCDRYYEEYGDKTNKPDLMEQIKMGQWLEKYEVLHTVLGSLREIVE